MQSILQYRYSFRLVIIAFLLIADAKHARIKVYECMVRGIAVMRRRADSYVNATQILKVAGVDKGRRTKILEKEILPGKHEIVQGGYGKYQGTWIPLERGRDIATQYGVAPLLAPLFDFVPVANSLGPSMSQGLPNAPSAASPRPLSAASSFSSLGTPSNLVAPGLAPPPIMPGSALRLLNQGRAQGLFTPSTSGPSTNRPPGYASPGPYYQGGYPQSPFQSMPGISPTPPPQGQLNLKRTRSDTDVDHNAPSSQGFPMLAASPDIQMADRSRPPSTAPLVDGGDHPSPTKRARTEPSHQATAPSSPALRPSSSQQSLPGAPNGFPRADSSQSLIANGKQPAMQLDIDPHSVRFASKPSIPRTMDPTSPLRDTRRAVIIAAICQRDEPNPILEILREIPPDNPGLQSDIDLVLDDQGHTALHLAASMARQQIVEALIAHGADVYRGNYNGETPLMRAILATHNADTQSFHVLVSHLHASIRTLDTSRKTVLHHIVASAGVKGRALAARYYLDQIFYWIAQHQGGDFRSLVDLQDEHGDTALNIAARVGNRSLVRTLLDVGANRILPNKLGLRPGDFGVEPEEFGGPRAEDILSSLRAGPSAPALKSQDVLADIETMIHGLSTDFSAEIKTKQEALDVTQAHLRAATRELSEQRKQIQTWQTKCGELDLVCQRTRNLEKALVEDDNFDWTGRSGGYFSLPSGQPGAGPSGANGVVDTTFQTSKELSSSMDLSFSLDSDPPVPLSDSPASLVKLRRMKMWHERMERLLEERLKNLQGASAEKEFQCKKIIALCTGVPISEIEGLLDNLVVAVESEASIIDISRVSGFMQKVRNGII
ncbi:unnamed protein product [Somion occarium]|uniref:HTH APSES-type domain-containing protein n=1 Tax=Somion occarium TaxID=3059160 RepID=A0ABP1E4Q2_9APHY